MTWRFVFIRVLMQLLFFMRMKNDNYNYEKGVYSTITFRWDDSNRTLHISDREGRYPGMLEKRKFKVVLVNHRSGEGDKPLKGGKMVNYTGTAIEVKL